MEGQSAYFHGKPPLAATWCKDGRQFLAREYPIDTACIYFALLSITPVFTDCDSSLYEETLTLSTEIKRGLSPMMQKHYRNTAIQDKQSLGMMGIVRALMISGIEHDLRENTHERVGRRWALECECRLGDGVVLVIEFPVFPGSHRYYGDISEFEVVSV